MSSSIETYLYTSIRIFFTNNLLYLHDHSDLRTVPGSRGLPLLTFASNRTVTSSRPRSIESFGERYNRNVDDNKVVIVAVVVMVAICIIMSTNLMSWMSVLS